MRERATPEASLDFKGIATGHLENKSVHVSRYLLPFFVSGRGPIKSIPTSSQICSV